MATYSWNSNIVASDPNQYFTLNVTFDGGTFTWNVVPKRQDGQTGNVTRNKIWGLTVTIGGNQYYKGDVEWKNYTVGTSVYNGTTQLSKCTVNSGVVSVKLTGNYWYGTWNTTYKCSINQSITVVSPTVSAPTYTASGKYGNAIVGGYSTIDFAFSATPGTAGNTISNYKLYQDGVQVYSGATAGCTITAPQSGSHTYYVIAKESNGATGTSTSITITTVLYTLPAFTGVLSIRWSTGDSSGVASDDGEYARLSAQFTSGDIGGTTTTTVCKATVESYTGTINTSGGAVYSGQILTPESSYIVTYKLYDDYLTEANAIVRTDVISIGSRGLDLIHDVNDGYGYAFGMKSIPGEGNSAMPFMVNTLDAGGNITDQAVVSSTPQLGTPTVTRSSGLTLKSYTLYTWGRVAQLNVTLNGNKNATSGETIFQGAIDAPLPVARAAGGGYYDTAMLTAQVNTAGTITVKTEKAFNYTSTYDVNVSITYLF